MKTKKQRKSRYWVKVNVPKEYFDMYTEMQVTSELARKAIDDGLSKKAEGYAGQLTRAFAIMRLSLEKKAHEMIPTRYGRFKEL